MEVHEVGQGGGAEGLDHGLGARRPPGVDADGTLCLTNHPLHRHPDPADLPPDTGATMRTYTRAATLSKRVAGPGMDGARLREALDEVAFDAATAGPMPLRTLWRTVFDPPGRTLSARFYLGDGADGAPQYSAERSFGAGR